MNFVLNSITSVHIPTHYFKPILVLSSIPCMGFPCGIFPLGFVSQILYVRLGPFQNYLELFCLKHFSFPNDLSRSLSVPVLRHLFLTDPSYMSNQSQVPCFSCRRIPKYPFVLYLLFSSYYVAFRSEYFLNIFLRLRVLHIVRDHWRNDHDMWKSKYS